MPRSSKVPSLTLHKPSGQARVRIGGKDHYLGSYGSPESYERYAELLRHQSGGLPTRETLEAMPLFAGATINEVILKFVKHSENYFSDEQGQQNQDCGHFKAALKLLRSQFGRLPIAQLTGPHLKEVQAKMVANGWARGYCNTQLIKIRRFLRWAVSEDICPVEVLEKARAVDGLRRGKTTAPDSPPVVPVADEIVQKTLPHLPPVVADLVRIIRLTGARPKEIRLLRIGDVVEIEGGLLETNLSSHKNAWRGHGREITFGPEASRILRKYLSGNSDDYAFSPRRSRQQQCEAMRSQRKSKVQPSQLSRKKKSPKKLPGDFYSAASLRRAISNACEVAFEMPAELRRISKDLSKVERQVLRQSASRWRAENVWHPYQLRHTALTQMRRNFDLETAQAVAGHARMDMTEHYALQGREKRRKAMLEIG